MCETPNILLEKNANEFKDDLKLYTKVDGFRIVLK